MKNITESPRPVTILSHNLWFSKALEELPETIREHNVGILALQETAPTREEMPDEIEGLRLAAHAPEGQTVGLAIYYDSNRWYIADPTTDITAHQLPPTVWTERFGFNPSGPRLLEVRLTPTSEQDEKIVIDVFHAANLLSLPRGRRKQISAAAEHTENAATIFESEAVLLGDSNYPFLASGRESRLLHAVEGKTNLVYVRSPGRVSTYNRGPLRGQYDRAWTTEGLSHEEFSVLPSRKSDHNKMLLRVKHRSRQA